MSGNTWRPGWLAAMAVAMTPVDPTKVQRAVAAAMSRGREKNKKRSASKEKRAEGKRAKAARRRNR